VRSGRAMAESMSGAFPAPSSDPYAEAGIVVLPKPGRCGRGGRNGRCGAIDRVRTGVAHGATAVVAYIHFR
ncbi:MAG: hypothetical protein ACLQVD_05750, partial [Capsulimonadaceae bacterium]